jgi:Ca2+:H+ antiporter
MSGDEDTTLLVAVLATKPLWEDDRLYVRWPANLCRLTWLVVATSYANVLLVFVPLGTIAGVRSWDPIAVFVLNFLAIVPLAALVTFATEELSAKLGQTGKSLVNAMFTNAVKLIVSKGGSGVTELERATEGYAGEYCCA